MSRRDPRRTLRVPVTDCGVAHLRARARGRSLADALRRIAESHEGDIPPAPEDTHRLLPVQLPARLRATLAARGADEGRAAADMLAGILGAATEGRT
jgi:hypothetical protein